MGLFLVKTQVEALGGRIEMSSQPDQGTTFTLYFQPL
jgi:signal transduction histidine kinase